MEKHKWFVPGFLYVFIVSSFLIFSSFLIIIPGEGIKASNPSVAAFKQNNSIQFATPNPTEITKQQVSSLATKQNQERIQVIPGGQSIGVQLHTKGVLVVGHHLVEGETGSLSPGEDALIQIGDMIIEMNGKVIETMSDVKPIVEQAGESEMNITVMLRRNDKDVETIIQPVLDKQENFQIGLYIRDSAAGIGTMSFYDPQSKKYGALGHVISDVDTQKPVETYEGSIVRSSVTSISKGNNGIPGEKKARFSIDENKLGTVNKNSPFGIFGTLDHPIKNNLLDAPMDVAFQDEVKKGPATILTVLENELVEQFDIEIVSSARQDEPETKGMVIKITDERLLAKTGGVVQGMSGSPIIQNNKIIGAVTHVFVNDPSSGYGVHIEWMLEDAEIIPSKIKLKAS